MLDEDAFLVYTHIRSFIAQNTDAQIHIFDIFADTKSVIVQFPKVMPLTINLPSTHITAIDVFYLKVSLFGAFFISFL